MDELLLSDIKTSVQGLLTDDQYDETLITEAANWVVYDLFASYRLRMAETSDTLSALAGATTLDMPADLLTRIEFYATAPQVLEMQRHYVQYEDFMANYADFATATAHRLREWTDFGKAIRFSAALDVNHSFQIDYLRMPSTMEDDSDACEIPRIYSELVSKSTLARIMEINEDYAEAQQERDNYAPLLTTFIRNEGRSGGKTGPTIVRTNRGKVGGYRVDRDF